MKRIGTTLAAALSFAAIISITPGASAASTSTPAQPAAHHIINTTFAAGFFSDLWGSVTGKPATPSAVTPAAASARPVATATAPNQKYVALGDSVAAGLGLPAVANATASDTQCGRSNQAYPNQVAASLNLPFTTVACSGAKVGDLFTKQAVDGPNITAQLDNAFNGGKPTLMTMTAGANDAHWDEFIRTCYVTNCANKTTTALANGYLKALQAKLHVAFTAIDVRSNATPPPVIVTGYYDPLSANCGAVQSNISAAEINWLSAETKALNKTIENVSKKYSFVTYVPVSFAGHDICSADPWVQGLTDSAPFHPNAAGQAAIAQAVIAGYNTSKR